MPHRQLNGQWHTVQQGQTLATIAKQYRVPQTDIEEINGVYRNDPLPGGRQLFIPGARGRTAPGRASRDTAILASKSPDAGAGADARATAARGAAPSKLLWPVEGGKLSSRFGKRGKRPHEGIDIAAAEGSAILAAADGVVIYAGSGLRGYGNLVIVRHGGGVVTVYAHNKRNLVREGVKVKQGQVIGEVGHTGRTTGNHLHFEVRKDEVPRDPLGYVRP